MTDIVERLRAEARRDPEIQHTGHSFLSDAADEIERLRGEVRKAFWAGFWEWCGPTNEREMADIKKAEVAAWEEYEKLNRSEPPP